LTGTGLRAPEQITTESTEGAENNGFDLQDMGMENFSGNAEIAARFGDLHPPLTSQAAIAEANRCLNCFDAPCMGACPTHIDVPRFIGKIARENLRGSALTILDANVLGPVVRGLVLWRCFARALACCIGITKSPLRLRGCSGLRWTRFMGRVDGYR
jgi:hypothetical protein